MTTAEKIVVALAVLAALGSGLMAGVFFAFSTAVMKALGRLPANEGIAAMRSINAVILNPVFLGVFMGTALASVVLVISSFAGWNHPGTGWLLAGSILYLTGSLIVTIAFNVPMNEALASASPENSVRLWDEYLVRWTLWNHVRTAASCASTVLFMIAALVYSSTAGIADQPK